MIPKQFVRHYGKATADLYNVISKRATTFDVSAFNERLARFVESYAQRYASVDRTDFYVVYADFVMLHRIAVAVWHSEESSREFLAAVLPHAYISIGMSVPDANRIATAPLVVRALNELDVPFLFHGEGQTRKVVMETYSGKRYRLIPMFGHSGEFNWGYGGSGPCELAKVLVHKVFGPMKAYVDHTRVKWEIVAGLRMGQDFTLPALQVAYVAAKDSIEAMQVYVKEGSSC